MAFYRKKLYDPKAKEAFRVSQSKIDPYVSQQLLRETINKKDRIIKIGKLKIKVCKGVFPPSSRFSKSSKYIHYMFDDIKGKRVLDIGTGTGIQAIYAAKMGAQEVIATDINPDAVRCALYNVSSNGVKEKINVLEGDLFNPIDKKAKFDLIIANLPIVDFPISGKIEQALYDENYMVHKKFLKNAPNYINVNGVIIMTHINFEGIWDFDSFEKMMLKYRFKPKNFMDFSFFNYTLRIYKLSYIKK